MTGAATTPSTAEEPKREKRPVQRKYFTELGVRRLKLPKAGQQRVWDDPKQGRGEGRGQIGLSVLLSSGGARTYQATFSLHGKPVTDKLGRIGEMSLAEARQLTRDYRGMAAKGIDPRTQRSQPDAPSNSRTYKSVVEEYIALYARPKQRTWDQTERVLMNNCKEWLEVDIASITESDANRLLDKLVTAGHGPKAAVTLAHLRKLWRWAYKARDYVTAPVMDAVEVNYEKKERDRVYNDEEIAAIWKAADQLEPTAAAYIKLLLLLAPRKTALALMRRADLNDQLTLWTTPFEHTKSRKSAKKKRDYLTPLPPLAQRILKSMLRTDQDQVFPTLPIHLTRAGRQWFDGTGLVKRLIARGAPNDFNYHACRHTIATWLQTHGHSEWERGLVLNHAGSGSVSAGYSHGYPLELKRELLTKWAEHVEQLVQPEGAALLR
jgi:integrase